MCFFSDLGTRKAVMVKRLPVLRCVLAALASGMLWLAGCASTPQASLQRDSEAKQFGSAPAATTLYVYRLDSAQDDSDSVLWIDNQLIGATLPRSFFRVNVDPGRHVLNGMAADNGRITLETRPGELVFVEMRLFAGQSRFRRVPAEIGQQVLTNCCALLENWTPGQRPLLH